MEFIEKHSSVRGKAVITVVCGKYKKEFQVTVWEKFLPDWVAGEYITAPYTNSGKTGLSVDISTSGKRALTYPYTDQKGIKLAAGETLTVSCDDTYEVQNYYVIISGNTDLQYTTVMHNGNPWVIPSMLLSDKFSSSSIRMSTHSDILTLVSLSLVQ